MKIEELQQRKQYHLNELMRVMNQEVDELKAELEAEKKRNGNHWMNQTQAAAYMGYTTRTVRNLTRDGKLHFNASGKIKKSDVDAFLKSYKPKRAKQIGAI